uniref:Uncharacterized protein n=1 Tax=Oryza meridionalis TaxID=40149 RepID=A0A0E0EXE1_9ORYZ
MASKLERNFFLGSPKSRVEAVAASKILSPQPSHQRIVSQVDVYHRLMAAAAAAAVAAALLVERDQED